MGKRQFATQKDIQIQGFCKCLDTQLLISKLPQVAIIYSIIEVKLTVTALEAIVQLGLCFG